MKQHARTIVLVLGLLGLFASVGSLYVHYQVLRDPSYQSFCDINETVSCEALYQSQYGTLFGVPVAAGGAIWSTLVLLLALLGMKGSQAVAGTQTAAARKDAGAAAGYVYLLSTLGLAVVLYLGYASFFVVGKLCPLCLAMYVSVIGTFLASGAAASVSLPSLPGRLLRDLRGALGSPIAATLGVLWLVGSVSLVAFFPRESAAPAVSATAGAAGAAAALPTERLEGAQLAQFESWIASQQRVNVPVAPAGAKVVVVKFNDYQCPACRQTYLEYKGIIAKYTAQYPGQVRFVTMDFPLETECNVGAIHASACEAAAAVRMARAKGKEAEMEEWLYGHQESLTPQGVKDAVNQIAQVGDFDAQYASVLEQVKADAKLGRELGVSGTPAFFVNGIRVQGGLRPVYFDALIARELTAPAAPAAPKKADS